MAFDLQRIYFGRLRKGSPSPEKHVRLIGNDSNITKIQSVISRNSYVKAEVVPSESEDKDVEQRIKVTILPGLKVGRFNESITVNTDHKEKKKLTLRVSGEIVGNIIVLPPRISFGVFRKGGKYNKTTRLKAAPGVDFKVLDVKSTIPGMTPEVTTIKEGTEYLVKVSISESFDKEILNGIIMITTDDKEQETISVRVSGRTFIEKPKKKPAGRVSTNK